MRIAINKELYNFIEALGVVVSIIAGISVLM